MLTVGPGGEGGPAQGGHFRIEPEQLEGAIQVFQQARDDLDARLWDAGNKAVMHPMGDDMISHMSADAFNEAADRARDVWDQALQRLDDIIAQLRRSKRAWDEAERVNAASWDR